MDRQDRGLAFMLQYENVAWFDGKVVRILDRRVYPTKVEFDLMKILPRDQWTLYNVQAIAVGRTWCISGRPKCEIRITLRAKPSSRR